MSEAVKVRLPDALAADLTELSTRTGATVSDLVRATLKKQLPLMRAELGLPPRDDSKEAV